MQLELMLSARFALIQVFCPEESVAMAEIGKICERQKRLIFSWDLADGWSDNNTSKGNPMSAIERIRTFQKDQGVVFILKDVGTLISEKGALPLIRALKNLAIELKNDRRCVILPSNNLLPKELIEEVAIFEFGLPNRQEIKSQIEKLCGKNLRVSDAELEKITSNFQGFTFARLQRTLSYYLAKNGKVDSDICDLIISNKKEIVRQTEILEFFDALDLNSIGGLINLKKWIKQRVKSFSQEAIEYGLKPPKGLLLVGLPGTGKSLAAKSIAGEWQLPLLRLDVGRLFGGIVGESESRIRQMIQLAEAISPCVLWIDEIDKGFGNLTSNQDGDSGTSRRVFGTLITWLQEKTLPVFLVLTCNNFELIPPELTRQGRIDEIFLLDLPNWSERRSILEVHLTKVRPHQTWDDLDYLASKAKGKTGAEIESSIYLAMQTAFLENRDFSVNDIAVALDNTKSQSRSSHLAKMRESLATISCLSASEYEPETEDTELIVGD